MVHRVTQSQTRLKQINTHTWVLGPASCLPVTSRPTWQRPGVQSGAGLGASSGRVESLCFRQAGWGVSTEDQDPPRWVTERGLDPVSTGICHKVAPTPRIVLWDESFSCYHPGMVLRESGGVCGVDRRGLGGT